MVETRLKLDDANLERKKATATAVFLIKNLATPYHLRYRIISINAEKFGGNGRLDRFQNVKSCGPSTARPASLLRVSTMPELTPP